MPAAPILSAGRPDQGNACECRTAHHAGGLGAPRGASVVEATAGGIGKSRHHHRLCGRARAPGPRWREGGNSPYAAALLRHLSAMKGAELSAVMRMVTEEVYLTTETRQRPWVNESLRRLLYLGVAPDRARRRGRPDHRRAPPASADHRRSAEPRSPAGRKPSPRRTAYRSMRSTASCARSAPRHAGGSGRPRKTAQGAGRQAQEDDGRA